MKKISLILLFTVIITTVNAQAPAILWEKSLGGSGDDYAQAIQQTSDGGYIVVGWSGSNDGDVTGNHGGLDYWIVKLLPNGSIQWQKSLGGSSSDLAKSICQTSDSGYIVAGQSNSNDGDVTGNHGGLDYWIVKLSSTGSIQWQKSLGGTGDEDALDIRQTYDGGYIIAGISNSMDGDVTGNHGDFEYPNDDYWIVKLSASGSIEWEESLGGTGGDGAYSVRQTSDSGYIVAGYSWSNNGDVTINHGYIDYWIVKLSPSGSIQWQKSLGGINWDLATSVKQTADGGYIVAGYSNSNDSNVIGNHGGNDYWIVKLSSSGNIQWQKSIGGSSDDAAQYIQQTPDGGYIVAGSSESNDGDVSENHGSSDYWIVKLNDTGAIQWQKSLGGSNTDGVTAIQQTTDGGYIVAGTSQSNDGDITGNHGNADMWVVKLGGTNAVNTVTSPAQITILPNPTTGNIFITGTNNASIKIYNTLGQLIKEANNTDNISIAEFPAGLYFVRVFNEQGQMVKQDKIVKE